MASSWGELANLVTDAPFGFAGDEKYFNKKIILRKIHDTVLMTCHIATAYVARVDALVARLAKAKTADESVDLENEIGQVLREWETKVENLGGKPKGLWHVDFDSGDGFFCWKFPQKEILYWHRYHDGATKKISVQDWLVL